MTKEAFARLAEEMRLPMYRTACAYLRQEADRLDAVQEALLKAWRARDGLKDERYFKTWLTRIFIRECVNVQRRQKRMTPVERVPEGPPPETPDAPDVQQAILSLPENQRIVIVLFYMEEDSTQEIARILRVPKGTVCSRLKRARQSLKQFMEEEAEQ